MNTIENFMLFAWNFFHFSVQQCKNFEQLPLSCQFFSTKLCNHQWLLNNPEINLNIFECYALINFPLKPFLCAFCKKVMKNVNFLAFAVVKMKTHLTCVHFSSYFIDSSIVFRLIDESPFILQVNRIELLMLKVSLDRISIKYVR